MTATSSQLSTDARTVPVTPVAVERSGLTTAARDALNAAETAALRTR